MSTNKNDEIVLSKEDMMNSAEDEEADLLGDFKSISANSVPLTFSDHRKELTRRNKSEKDENESKDSFESLCAGNNKKDERKKKKPLPFWLQPVRDNCFFIFIAVISLISGMIVVITQQKQLGFFIPAGFGPEKYVNRTSGQRENLPVFFLTTRMQGLAQKEYFVEGLARLTCLERAGLTIPTWCAMLTEGQPRALSNEAVGDILQRTQGIGRAFEGDTIQDDVGMGLLQWIENEAIADSNGKTLLNVLQEEEPDFITGFKEMETAVFGANQGRLAKACGTTTGGKAFKGLNLKSNADLDALRKLFERKVFGVDAGGVDAAYANRIERVIGEQLENVDPNDAVRRNSWYGYFMAPASVAEQRNFWGETYRQEIMAWLIPWIGAVVGWFTTVLGIMMCFEPVRWKGIGPIGWQGIVPARADIMASRCIDLMLGKLITVREVVERLDVQDLFVTMHHVMAKCSAGILANVCEKYWPGLYGQVPKVVREELIAKCLEELEDAADPFLEDVKTRAEEILDLKRMAVTLLEQDLELLVTLFKNLGEKEFRFVERTSAVLGFLIGLLQLVLYNLLDKGWLLPVTGGLIGLITNALSLWMIFNPINPNIIMGGYVNIQGVFMKRQKEVSEEMSLLMTTHVCNCKRLAEYIVTAPEYSKILDLLKKHTKNAITTVVGYGKNFVPIALGDEVWDQLHSDVVSNIIAELPNHTMELQSYVDRVFDLQRTLAYRMSNMPPQDFEGLLHPVFEQDEWMVNGLGAFLGVVVGFMQWCLLESL